MHIFELILERDLWMHDGIPFGQVGAVSTSGRETVVTFAAGCRLQITFDDEAAAHARLATCRIAACTLEDPFIILIRRPLQNRTQPYFMIPATLYGTNNADRGVVAEHVMGTGGDPKLAYRAPRPERLFSHSWHFRADHAAVPSVAATYDDHFAAMGIEESCANDADEWVYNGVGLWTSAEHGDSISVTLGSLDWPGRFVRHVVKPGRVVEPLTAATAVGMACRLCFYESEATDLFAYEPFITTWVDTIHESPREGAPVEQAMRDVAGALVADAIDPEHGYFYMYRSTEGFVETPALLAWAGVLQIARPVRRVGAGLGDEEIVTTASDMIDRAVAGAISPTTGLFFDSVVDGQWRPNLWWPGLGHSGLVNGGACHLLLKMAEEDPSRAAWGEAAAKVLERVLPYQREDGCFPGGLSPDDGTPLTYETFGGCYFASPLLLAHRLYGMPGARDAALRAIEHYWEVFKNLEWVGVDLDCAGAQDSGSSYALIRALVEQHHQVGGEDVLDRIGHVFHYAFTYRFAHNTRHRNPVCDWSSSGSKVTSTPNVHLDAFGGEILEELNVFLMQRDDPYLRLRLGDSLAWARQAYNRTEGEYGWGKQGWCTEQYYHTYNVYHCFEGDGTVWVGYFPWAAGSLLNAFLVEASGGAKG